MTNIAESLNVLYPNAKPGDDWIVAEDALGNQYVKQWNPALGSQPSPETISAVTQADIDNFLTNRIKANAVAIYDSNEKESRALRACLKVTIDEINNLRQWITAFKAATAAATSLADLKTRVAALADTPNRTYNQARTAITSVIDGE